jgi:hypothetical protein
VNTDIRLDVTLPTHPKFVRLRRKCGPRSMEHLVRFWLEVAKAKWSGVLEGWGCEDIEAAADWDGEAGMFCRSMIEVGMLEDKEGTYSVHDWGVHQPFVANYEDRREKKSAAGKASAESRKSKFGTAQPNRWPNTSEHTPNTCSDSSEHIRTDPTPCPSPFLESKSKPLGHRAKKPADDREPDGFPEFWKAYPSKVGKGQAISAWKKAKINGELETVLSSLAQWKLSPRWQGGTICNPATWINQRRWEDDPSTAADFSSRGGF